MASSSSSSEPSNNDLEDTINVLRNVIMEVQKKDEKLENLARRSEK
jgi:hypothetical protein